MTTFKPILSEGPKALEGASEWADKELEKISKEREASKMIYERIKPLRMEAFHKLHKKEKMVVD